MDIQSDIGYFIEPHEFDAKKLIFNEPYNLDFGNHNKFQLYKPLYKYTENTTAYPRIITEWFDLIEKPVYKVKYSSPVFSIKFNDSLNSLNSFIDVVNKYTHVSGYTVTPDTNNEYHDFLYEDYRSPIRNNTLTLKLKTNRETHNILTEIINYNVSDKYPSVEQFVDVPYSELSRFMYKNRQMRLIVSPETLKINRCAVSDRLIVHLIEIRYKNHQNFESVVDKHIVTSNIKNKEIDYIEI